MDCPVHTQRVTGHPGGSLPATGSEDVVHGRKGTDDQEREVGDDQVPFVATVVDVQDGRQEKAEQREQANRGPRESEPLCLEQRQPERDAECHNPPERGCVGEPNRFEDERSP